MTERIRCSKRIYGSRMMRAVTCLRAGIIERNGKLWCKQHDPDNVAAKRKALNAKGQAEHEAQNQVRKAAEKLATELGAGRAEYSALSSKGRYTGGIVLTAEEAQSLIARPLRRTTYVWRN